MKGKNFMVLNYKNLQGLTYILNKAVGLKACNSIKKRLQHSRFPVNIAKSLKTASL